MYELGKTKEERDQARREKEEREREDLRRDLRPWLRMVALTPLLIAFIFGLGWALVQVFPSIKGETEADRRIERCAELYGVPDGKDPSARKLAACLVEAKAP